MRAYTHPYERTQAHPTPMSTFERLSRHTSISTLDDDGVPAILQYRPSDLYLTDRKQTMAILQKDTRTSIVHPYLPQLHC